MSDPSHGGAERRRHPRYPVIGRADFDSPAGPAGGELLDIAEGGVLIRSDSRPQTRSNIAVHLTIQGYSGTFLVHGMVVRSLTDKFAVMFTEESATLQHVLELVRKDYEQEQAPAPN